MLVTNFLTDTYATNGTLLAYSVSCLVLARKRIPSTERRRFNEEERIRLVKYFDCLIEMEMSLKKQAS